MNNSQTMMHLHTMKWLLTSYESWIIGTDQHTCVRKYVKEVHLLITHTCTVGHNPCKFLFVSKEEVYICQQNLVSSCTLPMLLSDPSTDLAKLTYWKHDMHFLVKISNFIHNFDPTRITYLNFAISTN